MTGISAHSTTPPTPIVRTCSVRAALWINNHPKGVFLAFCVLAAGYGLALGFVPMSQDVFISVAVVGGVVLLVSAYVLKRLIYMSDEKRLQYLLGINNLKAGDVFYYFGHNNALHYVAFCVDKDGSCLLFDETTRIALDIDKKWVTNRLSGHQFLLTSPGGTILTSPYPEKILNRLRQFLVEKRENKPPEQLLACALGLPIEQPSKEITVHHEQEGGGKVSYRIEFIHVAPSWGVTIPTKLYNEISGQNYTGQTVTLQLLGPQYMNLRIIHYLRGKIDGFECDYSVGET